MCIDGDSPEVYRAKAVRARKAHKCSECSREIAKGEQYHYAFMIFDGFKDSFHTCFHCNQGQKWLIRECGGFAHSGLDEEMQEHADEYPGVAFGLNRIRAGMRRKWKRFDGAALMALPALPGTISDAETYYGGLVDSLPSGGTA